MADSRRTVVKSRWFWGALVAGAVAIRVISTEPAPASTPTAVATPSAAASAATPPPVVVRGAVMPDLVGSGLETVSSKLADVQGVGEGKLGVEEADLSPRRRSVWSESNWTVAATQPAAGESIGMTETVRVYVLRDEEYAWFVANPVMPAVRAGVKAYNVSAQGRALEGLADLIEFRYPKGKAPKLSFEAREPETRARWVGDLSVEPEAERSVRDGLRKAYGVGHLTVATLPSAGAPIRLGQLIVVLVREEPATPAPAGDGGGGVYVGGGDDDDDFNVPGWLCPTRFC